MTKQITLREIRYFTGNQFSRPVGSKRRLVSRSAATRIVRRLKRAGVAAFSVPLKVGV